MLPTKSDYRDTSGLIRRACTSWRAECYRRSYLLALGSTAIIVSEVAFKLVAVQQGIVRLGRKVPPRRAADAGRAPDEAG